MYTYYTHTILYNVVLWRLRLMWIAFAFEHRIHLAKHQCECVDLHRLGMCICVYNTYWLRQSIQIYRNVCRIKSGDGFIYANRELDSLMSRLAGVAPLFRLRYRLRIGHVIFKMLCCCTFTNDLHLDRKWSYEFQSRLNFEPFDYVLKAINQASTADFEANRRIKQRNTSTI